MHLIVAFVFMICVAIDAAFLASRVAHLNGMCTALAVFSAAILMGGILFTGLYMSKLER